MTWFDYSCEEFLGLTLKDIRPEETDRGFVIRNEQGEAVRMLGSMTDVTEKHGAELTHRLLAFARKQALSPKPIDVNQLTTPATPCPAAAS